jgi:hypothetical protein
MKTKPKAKRSTPGDQLQRFKDMAKEVGADEAPGALDRAFGKVDPKKTPRKEPKRP